MLGVGDMALFLSTSTASQGQFILPAALDYTAAFLFALTGALVAYERKYDLTGMAALALAVGLGGGIIRDGIFLQQVPAAVEHWQYLAAVAAAVAFAAIIGDKIEKQLKIVILVADAAGLGMYAAVGASKSLSVGLTVYAAGLIGIINATGGGMLRDMFSGKDPEIFLPGQLYATVALVGVVVFLTLGAGFDLPPWVAAVVCIAVTFVLRIVTVMFNITTSPAHDHAMRTRAVSASKSVLGRLRKR